MTASLPEYNNKIIAAASLAPIGYMNHMTSPLLKIMSYWTGTLSVSLKFIKITNIKTSLLLLIAGTP